MWYLLSFETTKYISESRRRNATNTLPEVDLFTTKGLDLFAIQQHSLHLLRNCHDYFEVYLIEHHRWICWHLLIEHLYFSASFTHAIIATLKLESCWCCCICWCPCFVASIMLVAVVVFALLVSFAVVFAAVATVLHLYLLYLLCLLFCLCSLLLSMLLL